MEKYANLQHEIGDKTDNEAEEEEEEDNDEAIDDMELGQSDDEDQQYSLPLTTTAGHGNIMYNALIACFRYG